MHDAMMEREKLVDNMIDKGERIDGERHLKTAQQLKDKKWGRIKEAWHFPTPEEETTRGQTIYPTVKTSFHSLYLGSLER